MELGLIYRLNFLPFYNHFHQKLYKRVGILNGKMAYKIGEWTKSALQTLIFIRDRNTAGVKPRFGDFPSGTFRNWLYPLKNAGYLSVENNGFFLTEKGTALLNQLIHNPPTDRRGRKKIEEDSTVEEKSGTKKNRRKNEVREQLYRVTIGSRDFAFDTLVSHKEAMEIIKKISEIKKDKTPR